MSEPARSRAGAGAGTVLLFLGAALLSGPWGRTGPDLAAVRSHPGVLGDPVRGAETFRDRDCIRCHTVPRAERGEVPSLATQGSRAKPSWMAAYLRRPEPLRYRSEGTRPRLRMPPLEGPAGDARDLAALLAGQTDSVWIPPLPEAGRGPGDASLAARGKQLFDLYQCRGCHVLSGRGNRVGPALDGVGRRRPAAYLSALLEDPQRVVPGTSMEDKRLWPEEIRAITEFLTAR